MYINHCMYINICGTRHTIVLELFCIVNLTKRAIFIKSISNQLFNIAPSTLNVNIINNHNEKN